jgi:uncharacterized RDD family membrane protein YckC
VLAESFGSAAGGQSRLGMRARSQKRRPLRYRGFDVGERGRRADPALALAPWGRRAVAYTVDSLLLIAAAEGTYFALEGESYFGAHQSGRARLLWFAMIVALATLYYALVMRASDGQTLGKWLLHIRVVRTDGRAMSAPRAIWRQVVLLVLPSFPTAGLPTAGRIVSALFVIDYLWPLWDRENRAIHDMLAGTRVRMARAAGDGLVARMTRRAGAVPLVCVLLIGCGGQRHAPAKSRTPSTAPTQPAFGTPRDEERAQRLAMAVIRARAKRNHPHARFHVATEAYWQSTTRYYDKAQGHLLPSAHPPGWGFDHEIMLVLELRPHHRLTVASYEEREVHVPPPEESP